MKVKKQLKARGLYANKKKQKEMIKIGTTATITLLFVIAMVNLF